MKEKTLYICTKCDAQFQKWSGQCFECGNWGTIEEEKVDKKDGTVVESLETKTIKDLPAQAKHRFDTGVSELDRVLGGGMVQGSLLLLGGEPGIGKSTLSLQMCAKIDNALYISGEESVSQIQMRAQRLGLAASSIVLAHESRIESMIKQMEKTSPSLVVIDSIQTMYSSESQGEPGSVGQIRVCTTKLLDAAKKLKTTVCIIGHVTKDGAVAGPKTLEHLVDVVLYLEGDRFHRMRLLRTMKNRFGATDEIGVFDMTAEGLKGVPNPSEAFLAERPDDTPGSVITCIMEGSRPLLVEVQALVNKTSFGYPVRKASGCDMNRLHVLTAVLEKRAGLQLGQYDIHLNVVGGLTVREPALDLAICLAIASSYKDKVLGNDLVVFGEVGLGGEVRRVSQYERRIKECAHLGMKRVVTSLVGKTNENVTLIEVKNIQELIQKT